MSDVTQILAQMESGDVAAADRLFAVVYDELRRMARSQMANELSEHTLQATALVHEVYFRLVGNAAPHWDGRGHFFASAAEAMRRILVDHARAKYAAKRGGELQRIDWDDHLAVEGQPALDLLALDEALSELESHDTDAARLVKLRYFAGFSHQEAAAAMQISRRQADRLWALAKAWLYRRLNEPP